MRVKAPAQNAPREREGLFDIVSCATRDVRPHPEERARRRSSTNSNARTRVSKDEDEQSGVPLCFETHRSAPRRLERPALASRCDAPQHEGERGCRAPFWRNEPNCDFGETNILALLKRRTNVPLYEMTGIVSGLFFTGKIATATCRWD
jgi:hypothetical protein